MNLHVTLAPLGLLVALACASLARAQATTAEPTTAQPASAQASTAGGGVDAPAAETPDSTEALYQRKAADALAEYDRGNWAEARALFLAAHELSPSARSWRTLGKTAFELRDYVVALRELGQALVDTRRPLDDRLRAEVAAQIERTRAFVGRFRVAIDPASASVFVDDQPMALEADGTLLLGLGDHVVRATADGHESAQRMLRVGGREEASVEIKLEPLSPPTAAAPTPIAASAPLRFNASAKPAGPGNDLTLTVVAATSAVVFGGTALGLWIASDAERDDLRSTCRAMPSGFCDPGDVSESKLDTLGALTTAFSITAGVAAAAAVVLYFVQDQPSESNATLAISGKNPTLVVRF